MGRPPVIPSEQRTRIVLSILAGEVSIAEAARKEKVSEASIGRWKADFVEAGKTALTAGRSGPSTREAQLEEQVADLTHLPTQPPQHPSASWPLDIGNGGPNSQARGSEEVLGQVHAPSHWPRPRSPGEVRGGPLLLPGQDGTPASLCESQHNSSACEVLAVLFGPDHPEDL